MLPPKTERFEMRLDPILIDRLDQWARQNGSATRTEAARELILLGLDKSHRQNIHFSDGEKLIIALLADLQRDKRAREIDTKKVMEAIYGGHLWALKWEMTGLFHDHVDAPGALSLVVDTLDMWTFIEEAVESFSAVQRKQLEAEVGPLGKNPKFTGFDGNNESEYFGIAQHLVTNMNRFGRFKGRSLNSHVPVVGRYARMTRKFQPIRDTLGGRMPVRLTLSEVTALLKNAD